MKLKRLISMLLAVSCLAAMLSSPNAVAEEIVFDKAEVVVGLGFMENGKNGEFNPDNKVTRAEFAEAVCKLLNAEPQDGELIFSDVDKTKDYYGYVFTACAMGLMVGKSSEEFKPEEFVTVNEAFKVMVIALGYNAKAEINGGYPVGYAVTANEIGIASGVSGNYMTKGMLANLIYNIMRTQTAIYEIEDSEYKLKKDKTVLAQYHNIEFGEGVVTANSRTGIKTKVPAGKAYVTIGDKNFITTDITQRDLLGYRVEYYAYENSDNEFELVFALPKKMDEVTISWENFVRAKSTMSTMYYTENDKEERISLADNISVIYNGVYYYEATAADMMPVYGDTTFIDNDTDGRYDVAIVNNYRSLRIGRAILEDELIYNNDATDSASTANCNIEALTFITDGMQVEITDKAQLYDYFTTDSVLLIAEAKDGSAVKIYLSEISMPEDVKGKLDEERFTSETSTYRLNPYAVTKMSDIALGQKYVLYMDAFGNVADFDITNTSANYAFLIKASTDSNIVGGNLIVKLYTIDGKFVTLQSGDKIIVKQGLSSKSHSPAEAYDLLTTNDETDNQLIIYHTNDDDVLTKIELAAEEIGKIGNDYFSVSWKNEKSIMSTHHHVMARGDGTLPAEQNGMYAINKGTYMTVPTKDNLDRETMYEVRPGSTAVINTTEKTLWLYDIKENGAATVILDMGSPVAYSCTTMSAIVVDRIYETLNADGDAVTAVDGFVNKLPYTYTFTDEVAAQAKTLKMGDVIFAWPNALGEIGLFFASIQNKELKWFDPVECYNNFHTFYNSSVTGHGINMRDNTSDLVMYQRFAMLGEVSAVVMQDANTYVVEITMKDLDSEEKDGKKQWTIKYRTNHITRTDGSVLICETGKNRLTQANVRDIRIGDKIYLTSFRNYGDARYGCVIYR